MLHHREQNEFTHHELTPAAIVGTLVPGVVIFGRSAEYRLVTSNGLEYAIVTNKSWVEDAAEFRWKKIKVIGLLDTSDHSLIPNRIIPLDSDDEPGLFSGFFNSQLNLFRNLVSGSQSLAT